MTVKELREKLAQFHEEKNVIIYCENGSEQDLFDARNLQRSVEQRRGLDVRSFSCLAPVPPTGSSSSCP
jgi:hypothetical protein